MIPLQVHALQAKEFPNEVATVTAPLCLACPAGKLLPIWDAGNLLERCDCWSAGCIRIHLACLISKVLVVPGGPEAETPPRLSKSSFSRGFFLSLGSAQVKPRDLHSLLSFHAYHA